MASQSGRGSRPVGGLIAAAAVAAVAVAGCATAPSGGPPQRATGFTGRSGQVQAYAQPLPPPGPTSAAKWTPENVVMGFLHASASYAFDLRAAQQYLVPALRKSWHPGQGPAAVVGTPTLTEVPNQPKIARPISPAVQSKIVRFSGQRLATLSQTGQYQYTPVHSVYEFTLEKINGVWRIAQLPVGKNLLLLTQSDFEQVYQPRNLFFFAPSAISEPTGELVPDPVYAPLQNSNSALNTDLATGLVKGLLKGPSGWLSGAATSAFPAGTTLLKQVTISGKTAEVDLGGAATHGQVQAMADQLMATLKDGSYSSPLATEVQLSINNVLKFADYSNMISPVTRGPVYLKVGQSYVGQLPAAPKSRATPAIKFGSAQVNHAVVTALAASPAGAGQAQLAVATASGNACTIYLGAVGKSAYQAYPLPAGSQCTSLSWDSKGVLWVAAGKQLFAMQPKNRQPVAVSFAASSVLRQPRSRILALRLAPDGVRAAMLVGTRSGNRLLLAAVRFHDGRVTLGDGVSVGTDLSHPIAVSWYDAYHLAVLASSGGIYDVPLTGVASHPPLLSTAPAGAQTLTADGTELVVGTSQGQIWVSSGPATGWANVTNGSDPVYPG